jgi:hypothetical protein
MADLGVLGGPARTALNEELGASDPAEGRPDDRPSRRARSARLLRRHGIEGAIQERLKAPENRGRPDHRAALATAAAVAKRWIDATLEQQILDLVLPVLDAGRDVQIREKPGEWGVEPEFDGDGNLVAWIIHPAAESCDTVAEPAPVDAGTEPDYGFTDDQLDEVARRVDEALDGIGVEGGPAVMAATTAALAVNPVGAGALLVAGGGTAIWLAVRWFANRLRRRHRSLGAAESAPSDRAALLLLEAADQLERHTAHLDDGSLGAELGARLLAGEAVGYVEQDEEGAAGWALSTTDEDGRLLLVVARVLGEGCRPLAEVSDADFDDDGVRVAPGAPG